MLHSQPTEIILEIRDWLNGSDFERLMELNQRIRFILRQSLRLDISSHFKSTEDIHCVQLDKQIVLNWTQNGSLLGRMRVKGIEPPTSEYPFGRNYGVRQDGDRTAISKVSLAHMCSCFMAKGAGKLYEPFRLIPGSEPRDHETDHSVRSSSYTSSSTLYSEKDQTHSEDDDDLSISELSEIDSCLYFEMTILKMLPPCCIRIGLVGPCSWNSNTPPGAMEGSIGYCSQDGQIAVGSKYDDKFIFGNPFGIGDTVGCGYTKEGSIFFTLNGEWIGEAPQQYESSATAVVCDYRRKWFAAVSSSHPAQIAYNFGQDPFLYRMCKSYDCQFSSIPPYILQRTTIPPQSEKCKLIVGNGDSLGLIDQLTIVQNQDLVFSVDFHDSNRITGRSLTTSIPLIRCQPESVFKRRGYCYFEVTIHHAPATINSFLSIGLSERPVPFLHHIGWNKNSIGYHSDDGHVFKGSYQGDERISLGFGAGSIIGVGYYPNSRMVFFTHDGLVLQKTAQVDGILYPAVAATSNWRITLNFGSCLFYYSSANVLC